MLLVYTHKITHRNKYIFNLLFKDILGIDFKLTPDREEFKLYEGAKLSYTNSPIGDELFFVSRNLLFETGITEQNISVLEFNNNKVFFATGKASVFPFDIFAASFYLVSRYEEYLPHIRDEHDRFDAKDSLAFMNGFLQKPMINIWTGWMKKILIQKFPELVFPEKKYEFISTIDIDNAYAYREKGLARTVGGYLKSLSTFNIPELAERTQVLLGNEKDPYDTYDFQLDILKKFKFKSIYFFLLGDYGVNDKNLPIESKKFQSLIKMLGDYADIGIHPSYGSNKSKEQLKKEVERLSNENKVTIVNNVNNGNVNGNVIINNNNNNINVIQIVNHGQEDYQKINMNEILKKLENPPVFERVSSVIYYIHCNDDYPEYQNIYVTDLSRGKMKMYKDGEWQNMETKPVVDVLYNKIIEHYDDDDEENKKIFTFIKKKLIKHILVI